MSEQGNIEQGSTEENINTEQGNTEQANEQPANDIGDNYKARLQEMANANSDADMKLKEANKTIATLKNENANMRVKSKESRKTEANRDDVDALIEETRKKVEDSLRKEFEPKEQKLTTLESYAHRVGIKGAVMDKVQAAGLLDPELVTKLILNGDHAIGIEDYGTGAINITNRANPNMPVTDARGDRMTLEGLVSDFAAKYPRFLPDKTAAGAGSHGSSMHPGGALTAEDIGRMTPEQYAVHRRKAGFKD